MKLATLAERAAAIREQIKTEAAVQAAVTTVRVGRATWIAVGAIVVTVIGWIIEWSRG